VAVLEVEDDISDITWKECGPGHITLSIGNSSSENSSVQTPSTKQYNPPTETTGKEKCRHKPKPARGTEVMTLMIIRLSDMWKSFLSARRSSN
jgi:hypothetical protein